MSNVNPGVIFDAMNSWSGYNHQGKLSLWYAISEITKLWDSRITETENIAKLHPYFLEIEYMEDFAIGKAEIEKDGKTKLSYISVHQVKNRDDQNVKSYESALLGLLSHVRDHPEIKTAMLHTTVSVKTSKDGLSADIAGFLKEPSYLKKDESEIKSKRKDSSFREQFTRKSRRYPKNLKANLIHALQLRSPTEKELNDTNLDTAFDAYLEVIKTEREKLRSVQSDQIDIVSVCNYLIDGKTEDHCEVDAAAKLLLTAIQSFYKTVYTDPGDYKTTPAYAEECFRWLLQKLDEYIVERDLHFDLYKKGVKDRCIYFSVIYEWLVSDKIHENDTPYYLFHIKETMFQKMEEYCNRCNKPESFCKECRLEECQNKLRKLTFNELRQFSYFTNPRVNKELSMQSYADFLGDGVKEPFSKGLRDIAKPFDSDRTAISYKSSDQKLYTLTTLHKEHSEDDDVVIATEIYRNKNVYELLMDITGLISKDIDITSIQDLVHSAGPRINSQREHIAYPNPIQVISLDEFLKK